MKAIGVDIGGTKIAVGLVQGGKVLESASTPTPANSPAKIIAVVIDLCRPLLAAHPVAGVGVGTAGQVNPHTGRITYAVDTLPGWGGTALGEELARALACPVRVENDVNAMAIGEMSYGAGRGLSHALYLTVGTGIGGALIWEGHLWPGTHFSAGELGHILVDYRGERVCNCGQRGHLEAYAAGPAIEARYGGGSRLPEIVARAESGEARAREALQEGATILGAALVGLANTFDPQAIIIGGGVAESGPLWWRALEAALRESPMPAPGGVALLKAQLGPAAVMVGAAQLVEGL
jgi:glucokinase